jgi:hypothetical protein
MQGFSGFTLRQAQDEVARYRQAQDEVERYRQFRPHGEPVEPWAASFFCAAAGAAARERAPRALSLPLKLSYFYRELSREGRMARRVIEVFLSSTAKDLAEHRKALHDRLMRAGLFHCIWQEDFGAQNDLPSQAPAWG